MGKPSKKNLQKTDSQAPNPVVNHAIVIYAAWNLLHMEKNGLLQRSATIGENVSIKKESNDRFSKAIRRLDVQILNLIKVTATKKTLQQIRIGAEDIINRFFDTKLQREGVVPPLLFACILYVYFVESGQKVPLLFSFLQDPKLYDGIFIPIEEADIVSWSKHIGAAQQSLELS